jgi:hypothetical protein
MFMASLLATIMLQAELTLLSRKLLILRQGHGCPLISAPRHEDIVESRLSEPDFVSTFAISMISGYFAT